MLETFNREEKSLIIRSSFASKAFLEKLNQWRERNLFTDIVLCSSDGMELSAHKVILSCCSPYFEAMFCGNFAENNTSTANSKISIGGITGIALKLILDYIYSGTLKITMENAEDLLQITDLLLLEQVSIRHRISILIELYPKNFPSVRHDFRKSSWKILTWTSMKM